MCFASEYEIEIRGLPFKKNKNPKKTFVISYEKNMY